MDEELTLTETEPVISDTPALEPESPTKPETTPIEQETTFVPFPMTEVLDNKSKGTKVTFWYPQSDKPELSINGSEFKTLGFNTFKSDIFVEFNGEDIFPLVVVFRNEYKTFVKQTFESYGGRDATQVSIQRTKE